MKLRNKKTGEIIEGECFTDIVKKLHERGDVLCYGSLLNVDLFAEYWKEIGDYEPAEPLIKNEKIRKAVRAWAVANDLDNFRVQNEHFNCCKIIGYTAGINKASFIEFQTTIAYADSKKLYTIDELCGEEEEWTEMK